MARMNKINRRRFLGAGVGGLGLLGAGLIGCGDDDDSGGTTGGASSGGSTPGASGSPGGGSSEEIKRGGTLRIGSTGEPFSLEVHTTLGLDNVQAPFDKLTSYDHQFTPLPKLAESWEHTDDGATLVLKLRQGVKYHSGRDFTSEDVAWNFTKVKDPSLPFAQFRVMSEWFTVETPDDHTAILKSTQPRPGTFDFFQFMPISDRVTEEGPDKETTLVGTGPWKFVEWRQGVHFMLEKNPEYWDTGIPYLDGVTFTGPLDIDALVAQLEAGAQDLASINSMQHFIRLRENPSFQTLQHPSPGAIFLNGFNTTLAPFNDNRVRQALTWGIDKQRFASLIMRDTVEPKSLPWPDVSPAYEAEKDAHYQFDLKKAADLLSAANASNLQTKILTAPGFVEPTEFMPIYAEDLKQIGVDLEINVVETVVHVQSINSLDYEGLFAAWIPYSGMGYPGSMFFINPQAWSGDGNNNTGFQNARWQELIEQATYELDPQKQQSIFFEMNDIFLEESHLPVYAPRAIRSVMAGNVRGFTYDMQDSWDYTNTWLA